MKKVAIVGTADTMHLAPYNDPSYEIWVCNDMYKVVPRFDRLFELHKLEVILNVDRYKRDNHLGKLAAMEDKVIYMQERHLQIPCSVRYPIEKVIEKFGNYFTSTASYQIALTLLEDFDTIELYGINMAAEDEYANQRPSCEYFIGIAKGMGKQVYIPEQSDLLKTYSTYAYETEKQDAFIKRSKERLAMMRKKKKEVEDLIAYQKGIAHQYTGAIADLEQTMKLWNIL